MIFKGLANGKFPWRVTRLGKHRLNDTPTLPFQDFSFACRERCLAPFRGQRGRQQIKNVAKGAWHHFVVVALS